MWYGRTGIDLEIDLSQGKVEKKEGDPRLFEDYLGGKGINAKIAWDRLPPELDPFSPDNLLIFGTGLLVGTPVPAANRSVVSIKSPQVDFFPYSVFGGYWGPELKNAGYDTLIISGKSPTPVYLWIDDDQVEIRDAGHLWGKDTFETQTLIREDLKGKVKRKEKREDVQIVCIGPAGENKVYAASIEHSIAASASRKAGIIMGDKNLKAIAVHGTKDINIARPAELMELCNQIIKRQDKLREMMARYPYTFTAFAGGELHSPDGFTSKEAPEIFGDWGRIHTDFNKMYRTRDVGCYNCPVNCRRLIILPGKRPIFVKCASWYQYQLTCHASWEEGLDFYRRCEGYGVDCFSIAVALGFATNLYLKGILTKKDTDGLELGYKYETMLKLLDKIVHREGIGDVLANGTYEAVRQIGKGAEEEYHYTHHVARKDEMLSAEYYFPIFAFLTGVSDKTDLTRSVHFFQWMEVFLRSDDKGKPIEELYSGYKKEDFDTPYHPWPKVDKEEYIKEGWFNYPEEFQAWFLDDNAMFDVAGERQEDIAKIVNYGERITTLTDITGICFFHTGFCLFPPISGVGMTSIGVMAKLISYTTGMDIDETEALKIISRVQTLVRAYNVRAGLRRKDDRVPNTYFEKEPKEEYLQKLDPKKWDNMLNIHYNLKGWDKEGIPTKETLEKLGLGYVREELERRGVLSYPEMSLQNRWGEVDVQ